MLHNFQDIFQGDLNATDKCPFTLFILHSYIINIKRRNFLFYLEEATPVQSLDLDNTQQENGEYNVFSSI